MIIIPAIILVIVIYLVGFYNSLKTSQVQIEASIQEIGNQLKRQAGLIPNLLESVKGYLKHEKSIFEELTSARKLIDQAVKTNDPKSLDKAQDSVSQILKSLNVIVESNPEIKASGLVENLMNELRDTADKLMYSRRTLIDLSADFNIKISTVPGLWLAPSFGFKPQSGLKTPNTTEITTITEAETKSPEVKF